jgi:hypothetical protein
MLLHLFWVLYGLIFFTVQTCLFHRLLGIWQPLATAIRLFVSGNVSLLEERVL